MSLAVRADVPLAPLTTLGLGGAARHYAEVKDEAELEEAFRWAKAHGAPVTLLGGGSNVVVADRGVLGLTLRIVPRGIEVQREGNVVSVRAAAGEPWDPLVAMCVTEGWAGVECLSGIPGLVGATPIQNVGAYGQEVSQVLTRVSAYDRTTGEVVHVGARECAFSYRDSAFKRAPNRFVVLAVEFRLRAGGAPSLRYGELSRALAARAAPSLGEVRDTVMALRRQKSMVLDEDDPNRKSAGSFFTNPIVDDARAEEVVARAVASGAAASPDDVPRYPAGKGRTKLAAGWLIERAGVAKGLRRGAVGVSTRHALSLVHHGGGTAEELLDLAREVRDKVERRFSVILTLEPRLLGFDRDAL